MTHFELLKYAATGIASPGMTAYDKMRAVEMASGGAVKTLTGVPPLSFTGNGKPLISWSMLGNGQQNGTPTPDNPIYPQFVGEIDNIFEGNIEQGGYSSGNPYTAQNRIRSDTMILVQPNVWYYMNFTGLADQFTIIQYTTNGIYSKDIGSYLNAGDPFVFSSAWKLKFVFRNSGNTNISPSDISNIILSRGYKLPITCAGQTTPIYLGQTQTVRKIGKWVLTGEENWVYEPIYSRFYITVADFSSLGLCLTPFMSNAFGSVSDGRPLEDVPNNSIYSGTQVYDINKIFIKSTNYTTLEDWKAYLAAQYAAGQPVAIWYILAEPKTAIVNEPLAKIGDYADELHSADAGVSIPTVKGGNTLTVDTDLKPSSMTITYRE